jgi:hypothetical protein
VHAPSEEKSDDSKDSIYEEFEQVFLNHCGKYHTNIPLGDLLQNWGGRIFSNRQFAMSVHQESNYNAVI